MSARNGLLAFCIYMLSVFVLSAFAEDGEEGGTLGKIYVYILWVRVLLHVSCLHF